MYKIIYTKNNIEYVLYGFQTSLIKQIAKIMNDEDEIEILFIFKLCFSISIFKKCLKNINEKRYK